MAKKIVIETKTIDNGAKNVNKNVGIIVSKAIDRMSGKIEKSIKSALQKQISSSTQKDSGVFKLDPKSITDLAVAIAKKSVSDKKIDLSKLSNASVEKLLKDILVETKSGNKPTQGGLTKNVAQKILDVDKLKATIISAVSGSLKSEISILVKDMGSVAGEITKAAKSLARVTTNPGKYAASSTTSLTQVKAANKLLNTLGNKLDTLSRSVESLSRNKNTTNDTGKDLATIATSIKGLRSDIKSMMNSFAAALSSKVKPDDDSKYLKELIKLNEQQLVASKELGKKLDAIVSIQKQTGTTTTSKAISKTSPKIAPTSYTPVSSDSLAEAVKKSAEELINTQSNYIRKNLKPAQVKSLGKLKDAISSSNLQDINKSLEAFGDIFTKAGTKQAEKIKGKINNFVAAVSKTVNGMEAIGSEFKRLNVALDSVDAEIADIKKKVASSRAKLDTTPTARLSSQTASVRQMTPSTFKSLSDDIKVHKLRPITPKKGASQKIQAKQFNSIIEQSTAESIAGLEDSLHELQTYIAETLKAKLQKTDFKLVEPKDMKDITEIFSRTKDDKLWVTKLANVAKLKKATGMHGMEDLNKLITEYKKGVAKKITDQYTATDAKLEGIGKWIKTAPAYKPGTGIDFDYSAIQKKFNKAPEVSAKMMSAIKKAAGGDLKKIFEQTFVSAKVAMDLEVENILKSVAIPVIKSDKASNPFLETKLGSKRAVPKFATYTSGFEGFAQKTSAVFPQLKIPKEQALDIANLGFRPTGTKLKQARATSKELFKPVYGLGGAAKERTIGRFAEAAPSKAAELARVGAIGKDSKAITDFEQKVNNVAKDFQAGGEKANKSFEEFTKAMDAVGITAYDAMRTFEEISTSNLYDKMLVTLKANKAIEGIGTRPKYDKSFRTAERTIRQVEQFAPVVGAGKPRRGAHQSNVVQLSAMTGSLFEDIDTSEIEKFHKNTITSLNRRLSEITKESDILLKAGRGEAAKTPASLANISSLGLPEEQASVMLNNVDRISSIMGSAADNFEKGIDELAGIAGVTIKMHADDLTSLAPFGRQFQQPGRNISNISNASAITQDEMQRAGLRGGLRPELPTLRSAAEDKLIQSGKYGGESQGYGYNVIAELRNTAGTFEDQILVSGKMAKAITAVTKNLVVAASAGPAGKGADQLEAGVLADRIGKATEAFAQTIGAEGYQYKGRADKALLHDVKTSMVVNQGQSIEVQSAKVAEIFLNTFGRKLTTRYGSKGVSVTPTGDSSLAGMIKEFAGSKTKIKIDETGLGVAKMPKSMGKLVSELLTSSKTDTDLGEALEASGNKFVLDMFKDVSSSGILVEEEARYEQMLYEKAKARLDSLYGVNLGSDVAGVGQIKSLYGQEVSKEGLIEVKPIDVRISSHGLAKRGLQPELLETIMGNVTGGAKKTTLKTDVPDYKSLLGTGGTLSKASASLGYTGSITKEGRGLDELTTWAKAMSKDQAQRLINLEKNSSYYVDIIDELGKERKSLVGPKFMQIIEEPGANPAWSPKQIEAREKGIKLNLPAYAAYETIFGQGSDFMKSINTDIYASNKEQWEYIKALQASMKGSNTEVVKVLEGLDKLDISEFKKQPERLGTFDKGAADSLLSTVADTEKFAKAYSVALPTAEAGVTEDFYLPGPSIRQATPDTLSAGAFGMSKTARDLQNVIDAAKDVESSRAGDISPEKLKESYRVRTLAQKYTPEGIEFIEKGIKELGASFKFHEGAPVTKGVFEGARGALKTKINELEVDDPDLADRLKALDPNIGDAEINHNLERLESAKLSYYEGLAKSVLGKGKGVEQAVFQKRIPAAMEKAVTAIVDKTDDFKKFQSAIADIKGDLPAEFQGVLEEAAKGMEVIGQEHAENISRYRKLKVPVLKQHEIGIHKKQAAKIPGLDVKSKEDQYVESVRFPFTGTSSVQPYKAKILEEKEYENVFAVPGVPEFGSTPGTDFAAFEEQIGKVQGVRTDLIGQREEAWKAGEREEAEKLTSVIEALNHAISDIIPKYVAQAQKLDFDGDAIQIHSATTKEAREDIKSHFDKLTMDVSSTAAVFRDKFTGDATQKSTGKYMMAEMAMSFDKKFTSEKGFKFMEAPAITKDLEYLSSKEKVGILSGSYTTAGSKNPMAELIENITAEIGNPKHESALDSLLSKYGKQTTTVESLDKAINKLDPALKALVQGFITSEVYAVKFGDAVEAQLFKIHTGPETEGMTRMQRVFENRMGTGPGMISEGGSFAKERTTQINELLRFGIQKGMDVKHAGGPTVASDIIDAMTEPDVKDRETKLDDLMMQIKERSGSYGELEDFRQANEQALRGQLGAKDLDELKSFLTSVLKRSDEVTGTGKRSDFSVTGVSDRSVLIDKAIEVLGFEGFMEDLQLALAAEISQTTGKKKSIQKRAREADPLYTLRTSGAKLGTVGGGKTREEKLANAVKEVEKALLATTKEINSEGKRQGAYVKSVEGALTMSATREAFLKDFQASVGDKYTPTPSASGADMIAKIFSDDLPDTIRQILEASNQGTAGKLVGRATSAAGVARTAEWREDELRFSATAPLSAQAGKKFSNLLGEGGEETDEYKKAVQDFVETWQERVLTLNKIDKVLDIIKSDASDYIATVGVSSKVTAPSTTTMSQEQVLRAAGQAEDTYNISGAFQERSSTSSAAPPVPPIAGVSAGMPVGDGRVVDVRLVDVTSAVISMLGTGISKSPVSAFEAKAQDMSKDPNSEYWLEFNDKLNKRAEEIKATPSDFLSRESDLGADPNIMGGPALAKQRAAVKAAAEAASEYDYLEAAPRVSDIKGPVGTFENLQELHAQARDFLDKARGISFAKEEPTMNPEIKKLIGEVGQTGPNYKEFFNTVDELKQAATIEGSDAFKAFKLYKLAVGDFYLAKTTEAKQMLDAAETQPEKQKHYTDFTGFIDKFQTSIRSGLGKQSDIYTQDKRYVSPNLARGAGVYMSPAQIGQKAAAPLPEDQKIYDIYKGIIGDTGGGEFMKAPIEKAREAVKELSNADDEMIKLMESGEIMERIGSDIKEAWDFKSLSDNISRLREALELYKKYSVSEDSMAAERKNIDSVIKYLKNVEDIYTKIDTSKAVTQGPAKWGETGVIKVPTWLDPEQQLGLHKRNVQKIKEYYTKASSEGGAKIGERQEYKSQVRGTGGEILSNKVTDFHKYAESLDNAGDAIGRYSAKERDLTEIMQGSTRNFGAAITRAIKWGAASSIVYGGFQQLRSAIGTMADIETSLAQLRMVMNPMGADFGALGDAAVMFAKKYGVGVDDALQSMKVFAQQGLSQAEIIDRTNTSTLAANVTTLSATDATEALTAAMKIFGNEADSSMKYLDAWSEVEARHAITAEDMANAIKKSASAAKNAGVTFDQLNGIVAAIGSTTRQSGKEVGTSMRFIFRRLSSDKGPKELAKLQVPTLTGEGELRSGFDVLGDLAMKWKDLTSAQKMNTAQAIGGTRQYNSLLVLMDNWDQALQAVKDSTNSKGSAERKNAEIMKTYTKQLEQTKAAAVELQMAFGKVVLPGFKAGLKVTRTLLETISAIPDPIKAAAAGSVLFLTYLSKGADIIDAIKGGLGGVGGLMGGLGKSLKEELDMARVEVLGDKGISPLISTGLSTLGKPVMKEVTGPDGKKIMEPQKQTLHEFQSTLGKTVYLIKEMGMTYNEVMGGMAASTGGFVEKAGDKLSDLGTYFSFGAAGTVGLKKAKSLKGLRERASNIGLGAKEVKATLAKDGLKGLGKVAGKATLIAGEVAGLGTTAAGIVIEEFGSKLGAGGKKVAEDWAKSNAGLAQSIGPLAATTLLLAPALKSIYGHYIGLTKTAKDYKESIYGVKRTQEEELASIRGLIGEYSTLKMKMDDIAKASDPSTKARRQELGTYESPLLSTAKIYSGAKSTANELAESNANLVVGYDALGNAILRTSDNFQQFLSVVEKSKLKEIAKTDVSVAAKYIDELTTTEGPEQWKYGIKQFVSEVPVIGDMLAKGIDVSPAKMLKVMTDNLNKALGARSKNPMATAIDKDIKDYQAQLSKIRTGFQSSYADFRTAISDISTKGLDANEITNIFSAPELRKGWELMLEVEPTLNTNALRGKTTWQDLLGSEVLGRANQGTNLGFTGALTKAQLETAGGTSRKDTVRSNDIVTFLDSATDDYNIAGNQAIVKLKETTDGVFEWVAQYFNTKTLKIEERAFDEDIQSIVDGIFPQQAIQEDLSERIEALNEFVAGAGAGLRGIDKKTFKKDFSLGERFYSDITTSTLLQSDKGFTPGPGGGFGPIDFQSDWAESFKQFYAKPMEEYKNKLANIDKLRLAGLDGEKVNLATGLYEDLVKLQEVLKNNQVVLQYRAVLVDLSKTFEQGARAIQESLAVERSRMEIFKGQGRLSSVPEGLDILDIKGYSRSKMTASERVFSTNPEAVALAKQLKELELTKTGTAEQVYSADKSLIALQSIQAVSKGFGATLDPGDLSKYTETVARTGDTGIAELKLDTNKMVDNTAATVERLDAILANISGISEIDTLSDKFDTGSFFTTPEKITDTLEKVARVREKAISSGDTGTVVASNTLLDKLSQQLASFVGVAKSIKMVGDKSTFFSKRYSSQEQSQRVFGGLSSNQLVGELKDVLPQERKWFGLRAVEGQPTFNKDVDSLKRLQEKNNEEQLISSKNIIKAASASSVYNAIQTRSTNKTLDKYDAGISEKVTGLEKARGGGDEQLVNKLIKEISAMTQLRDKEQKKADFSGTVRNMSMLTTGSMQFAKALGLTETQIKVLGVGSVGLYSAIKLTSKIMGEDLPESAKAFEEALRSAMEAMAKGEKPSASAIYKAHDAGKKMKDEFPGKAAGGPIYGPGSGTSDDVMAMLSNGEYVIKAASAAKLGRGRLDYMNEEGELPGFASGGMVPYTGPGSAITKRTSGLPSTLLKNFNWGKVAGFAGKRLLGPIGAAMTAYGLAKGAFQGDGKVNGPGTGKSDSILAEVSNGEYIMKAAASAGIGKRKLDYMNHKGKLPGFAEGGAVGDIDDVTAIKNALAQQLIVDEVKIDNVSVNKLAQVMAATLAATFSGYVAEQNTENTKIATAAGKAAAESAKIANIIKSNPKAAQEVFDKYFGGSKSPAATDSNTIDTIEQSLVLNNQEEFDKVSANIEKMRREMIAATEDMSEQAEKARVSLLNLRLAEEVKMDVEAANISIKKLAADRALAQEFSATPKRGTFSKLFQPDIFAKQFITAVSTQGLLAGKYSPVTDTTMQNQTPWNLTTEQLMVANDTKISYATANPWEDIREKFESALSKGGYEKKKTEYFDIPYRADGDLKTYLGALLGSNTRQRTAEEQFKEIDTAADEKNIIQDLIKKYTSQSIEFTEQGDRSQARLAEDTVTKLKARLEKVNSNFDELVTGIQAVKRAFAVTAQEMKSVRAVISTNAEAAVDRQFTTQSLYGPKEARGSVDNLEFANTLKEALPSQTVWANASSRTKELITGYSNSTGVLSTVSDQIKTLNDQRLEQEYIRRTADDSDQGKAKKALAEQMLFGGTDEKTGQYTSGIMSDLADAEKRKQAVSSLSNVMHDGLRAITSYTEGVMAFEKSLDNIRLRELTEDMQSYKGALDAQQHLLGSGSYKGLQLTSYDERYQARQGGTTLGLAATSRQKEIASLRTTITQAGPGQDLTKEFAKLNYLQSDRYTSDQEQQAIMVKSADDARELGSTIDSRVSELQSAKASGVFDEATQAKLEDEINKLHELKENYLKPVSYERALAIGDDTQDARIQEQYGKGIREFMVPDPSRLSTISDMNKGLPQSIAEEMTKRTDDILSKGDMDAEDKAYLNYLYAGNKADVHKVELLSSIDSTLKAREAAVNKSPIGADRGPLEMYGDTVKNLINFNPLSAAINSIIKTINKNRPAEDQLPNIGEAAKELSIKMLSTGFLREPAAKAKEYITPHAKDAVKSTTVSLANITPIGIKANYAIDKYKDINKESRFPSFGEFVADFNAELLAGGLVDAIKKALDDYRSNYTEKKAAGGFISGNGGPKEDNIPALLSNGEYVIKAHSTSKLGKEALDYMNTTGNLPGFAEGGMLNMMGVPGMALSYLNKKDIIKTPEYLEDYFRGTDKEGNEVYDPLGLSKMKRHAQDIIAEEQKGKVRARLLRKKEKETGTEKGFGGKTGDFITDQVRNLFITGNVAKSTISDAIGVPLASAKELNDYYIKNTGETNVLAEGWRKRAHKDTIDPDVPIHKKLLAGTKELGATGTELTTGVASTMSNIAGMAFEPSKAKDMFSAIGGISSDLTGPITYFLKNVGKEKSPLRLDAYDKEMEKKVEIQGKRWSESVAPAINEFMEDPLDPDVIFNAIFGTKGVLSSYKLLKSSKALAKTAVKKTAVLPTKLAAGILKKQTTSALSGARQNPWMSGLSTVKDMAVKSAPYAKDSLERSAIKGYGLVAATKPKPPEIFPKGFANGGKIQSYAEGDKVKVPNMTKEQLIIYQDLYANDMGSFYGISEGESFNPYKMHAAAIGAAQPTEEELKKLTYLDNIKSKVVKGVARVKTDLGGSELSTIALAATGQLTADEMTERRAEEKSLHDVTLSKNIEKGTKITDLTIESAREKFKTFRNLFANGGQVSQNKNGELESEEEHTAKARRSSRINSKFGTLLSIANTLIDRYSTPGESEALKAIETIQNGSPNSDNVTRSINWLNMFVKRANEMRPKDAEAQDAFNATLHDYQKSNLKYDYMETMKKYGFLGDPSSLFKLTKDELPAKKAMGGRIMSTFGSGGPKEDNVPAWLSAGEYVINAHAAAKLGDKALNHLNKTGNIPTFADGGAVNSLPLSNNTLNYNDKIILDATEAADLITQAIEDAVFKLPEFPELKLPEFPELKLPELPELTVNVPEIIIAESDRTMIVPDNIEISLSDNKVYLQDNKVEISNIDAISAAMSTNNVGADINNDIAELIREMGTRVDVLEELPEQIEMIAGANIEQTLSTMKADLIAEQNTSITSMDTTINNLKSDLDNMRSKQTGLSNRVNSINDQTTLKINELNTAVYSMRT